MKIYDGTITVKVRHIFLGIAGLILISIFKYGVSWFNSFAFLFNLTYWFSCGI
ncbi:unnamed protein product [marine sediment metagenome]|uniref:Uncharacterized protein n=1 Tax=marine sediment metagenome TaxID=412755 RepID=X0WGP9_9ZZZZ